MASAQPLRPCLILINHRRSTRFCHIWEQEESSSSSTQDASSFFAYRFPFLSYFKSASLHSSFPICSGFPLSHPHLPSLFPPGFHPARPFLASMATKPKRLRLRVCCITNRKWTMENATQLGSLEALFSGSDRNPTV